MMSKVSVKDKINQISDELTSIHETLSEISPDLSIKEKEELEKIKKYLNYYSVSLVEFLSEEGKIIVKRNPHFFFDFIREIEFFIKQVKINIVVED